MKINRIVPAALKKPLETACSVSFFQRLKKILPFALIASFAIATPAFAYTYAALVQTQETSGNSYNELGMLADIDNEYLADNGYITASGLDTRVEAGGVAIPHMLADDTLAFVYDVGANSTTNLSYTFGNTALTEFPIIVGYNGYVTLEDDASLELGNNFDIEIDGYINTADTGTIITKDEAFFAEVSAAGDIKAGILSGFDATLNAPSGTNLIDLTLTNIQVEKLEDNKVVLSYMTSGDDHIIHIGSISDGVVTWGAATYLNNPTVESNGCIAVIDSDTVIAFNVLGVYSTYDVVGYVGTVSGNTITFGAANEVITDRGPDLAAARVSDTVVGLHYGDSTSCAVIGIGISGDVLTEDTEVVLTADDIENFDGNSACWLQDNHTIFGGVNDDSTDRTTLYSITWSGTTPTKADTDTQTTECLTSAISVDRIDDTHALLAYKSEADAGYVWTLSYDANGLCTEEDSQAIATTEHIDVAYMSDNYFLVFYDDAGDGNDGQVQRLSFDGSYAITLDTDEHEFDTGAVGRISGCFYESDNFIVVYREGTGGDSLAVTGTNNVAVYDKSVTASGISSGEMILKVYADGTDLGISVDGVEEDTVALAGSSVTNNASDYNIYGKCLSYANSLTIDVGGAEVSHYEPATMILADTLLDETGANDGTITWGTNPAGVAVTIGSLTSASAPAPGLSGGDVATPDAIMPIDQPSGFFTTPISTNTTHVLYPFMNVLSTQSGLPLGITWMLVLAMPIIALVAIGSLHYFKNQFLTMGLVAVCMMVFWQMGIFPFWVPMIFGFAAGGIVIYERVSQV